MKILLINPPVTLYKGGTNPRIYMPIGLLYIAGQLEKDGYEVRVFDALLTPGISDGGAKGQWHFGASWKEVADHINLYRPDIVGITSTFSSQSGNAKKVAQIAKKISAGIITLVGGPHPSACSKDMFDDPNIDFTIIGEGEIVISKILRALDERSSFRSINGLCTRYGGSVIENLSPERISSLDYLAMPAYHLYAMEQYFYLQTHGYCARPIGYGKREVSVITSRGCPYNCVFCSIHPAMGKQWRAHSAKHVIDHAAHLISTYNVDLIHFEDDNFSLDKKRFIDIMEGLSGMSPRVKWDTPNGLRADSLDADTITQAIRSGCQYVVIAIESGVQRVLDEIIDKKLRLETILNIARICKKLNVELYAYYVIGLPGESLREIKATLSYAGKMALKYFVYPQISIAAPVFGSQLYDICEQRGYFADKVTPESLAMAYDSNGKGLIRTGDFSPGNLKKLLAAFNRRLMIIMALNIIRAPKRLAHYATTVMRNRYLLKKLLFNK